tara:strand:- start:1210 stop:1938 length:729 start_codon:yes stop_codon:yes gene_type:complete
MDKSKLEPKIILAIETSSKLCSIALWDKNNKNNKIIGHVDHIGAKVHNQHLLPSIKHLLEKNDLSLTDLDGIAIGVGPGSFTGLRIGCAAVQGLALSLEIPIFTCSSLRIMSQDFILKNINNIKNKICVILDANAGDYYIGEYIIKNNIAENINPDFLLNKQDLVSYFKNNNFDYYIGDICLDNLNLDLDLNLSLNNTLSSIPSPIPSSIALCELFSDILKNPIGPEDLEPVYLRTQKHWEK